MAAWGPHLDTCTEKKTPWSFWREIYEEKDLKDQRIIIKCRKRTKRRWQIIVAKMGAKSYEEALNKLMDLYEQVQKLKLTTEETTRVY